MTKFGIEYIYKNERWVFEIFADDWEGARQRLSAIGLTGRVFGGDIETINNFTESNKGENNDRLN